MNTFVTKVMFCKSAKYSFLGGEMRKEQFVLAVFSQSYWFGVFSENNSNKIVNRVLRFFTVYRKS